MASAKTPQKYVAFLRGINVGGKNILPMKDLAEIFRATGCEQVRTFIQSGNVLFSAEPNAESRLAKQITAAINARFGYNIPVVLRTLPELEAAVAAIQTAPPRTPSSPTTVRFIFTCLTGWRAPS